MHPSIQDDKHMDNDNGTVENSYVAYNDLGSDEEICDKNILTALNNTSDDQELENDNDCMLTETQDIEYGQNQPLTLKEDQGKFVEKWISMIVILTILTLKTEILGLTENTDTFNYMNTEGESTWI